MTEPLATTRPGLTPVEAASASRIGAVLAHPSAFGPGSSLVPQMPAASASLVQAAADDETLHAAAIGNSAHLRLQTASGQDLSLHIRVRDGIADIRVDGSAGSSGAPSIELRASEVRTALAGEGISLGTFESPTSVAGVPVRDLAPATAALGVQPAGPTLSDGGARFADRAQAATGPWSSGASASVSELRSGDANANPNVNTPNTPNPNSPSANTGAQGYGYGHGAGSHSRSPSDSGANRDGSRPPRNPLQPSSSASTPTASSSSPSDPRANRGVHITA